jgi:hypothetical protein
VESVTIPCCGYRPARRIVCVGYFIVIDAKLGKVFTLKDLVFDHKPFTLPSSPWRNPVLLRDEIETTAGRGGTALGPVSDR